MTAGPSVSVVIATYNRLLSLLSLLRDLSKQTLPTERFEVVVIDDGSNDPVAPHLEKLGPPFALRFERQHNQGQAAARQRGALLACGEVIVVLDDDMQVPPGFLEAHLALHDAGARVVLGHIAAPDDVEERALFERFHLQILRRFVEGFRSGHVVPRGVHLCTGNVSFRRVDFLAVGGFDGSLQRSEDRELGIRLEKHGATFAFGDDAVSYHRTDHEDLEVWLSRAFRYGLYDRRIARKHEDVESADPWRFLFLVHPLSRPLLLFTVAAPGAGKHLARGGMRVAFWLDDTGLSRTAISATTLVYGVEYFRGMRSDAGSLPRALLDLARYLEKRGLERGGALARFSRAVRADYRSVQRYRAKYHGDHVPLARLPVDAVRKIGFQMMCAVRLMQLLRDARVPLGPQVLSRLIRHLYGAEVHWDADLAPGISLVHGVGLVVSHAARVDEGCILFQHATLGQGIDPATRAVGAPHLERDVHVGPGATVLGPITVGAGTKIMAGAVLSESVPPGSLVTPASVVVQRRRAKSAGPDTGRDEQLAARTAEQGRAGA